MNIKLYKSKLKGEINAPSSKSYTHRYLIAAALANKLSTISNVSLSDDIYATLSCLASFGCDYKVNKDSITIINSDKVIENPIFDCNESGSTLRFLIPIALSKYNKAIFKGSKRLLERGIDVYKDIFKNQDITITKYDDCFVIQGNLKAGEFEVDGSLSSQYLTGLLFTLPLLNGNSVIKIVNNLNSKSYVDLTLDVLSKYNIKYEIQDNCIYINGNQRYIAKDYNVEGDHSNAAFLLAFNYFNNEVKVNNLNENSLQGDKIYKDYFEILSKDNATLDISNCIDLGPILFAFASLNHGATFLGTNRLVIKESNRAKAMANELAKVGIQVEVLDDKVVIYSNKLLKQKEAFDSYNDHRIVMALSLLCCKMDIVINDIEAINKSYPSYFKDLESLGVKLEYETN